MTGEREAAAGGQPTGSNMVTLQTGSMVDQYEITGILGKGGMGTVYSGIQPVIGKKVAIKVINREFSGNPEVVARFIQEARAVNQAQSRYIVDIFAFGELDDGCHYYVMERVEGHSLEDHLRDHGGPLPLEQCLEVMRCVTAGLGAAHEMEIIHRDLKPANILVLTGDSQRLEAKILDFGIAKIMGEPGEAGPMTRTGAIFGTPAYMAPEQIRARPVDARTDIYALGVIMFQLFTGTLPFSAATYIDLVNKHLYEAPPNLDELQPELPTAYRELVLRCLQKEPDNRPATVQEVAAVLRDPAAIVTLPPLSITAEPPPPPPTMLAQPPAPEPRPKRGALWVVLALLGVGVIAAAAVLLTRNDGDPRPAAAAAAEPRTPPAAAPAPAPEPKPEPKPEPEPEPESAPASTSKLKRKGKGKDRRKAKRRGKSAAKPVAAPKPIAAPAPAPAPQPDPAPEPAPAPAPEPAPAPKPAPAPAPAPAPKAQPSSTSTLKPKPKPKPKPKTKPKPKPKPKEEEDVPFGF